MSLHRTLKRTAALAAATAMAAGTITAAASPAAADTAEARMWTSFSATAGSACFGGTSEGRMNWEFASSPRGPFVALVGTVGSGPLEPDLICPAVVDPRTAVVTFTGYHGSLPVGTVQERADGAPHTFETRLLYDPEPGPGAEVSPQRIDRIEVQVCLVDDRAAERSEEHGLGMFPDECGDTETYRDPLLPGPVSRG